MSSSNKQTREAKPLTMIRWYRINQAELSIQQFSQAAGLFTNETYAVDAGSKKCGAKLQARVSAALGIAIPDLFDEYGWPLFADVPAAEEVPAV